MIISRAPYRISLFGGGTDYEGYFRQHGGLVVGTAINQYCYVTAKWLDPYHEYHSCITYSKVEHVQDNDSIEHRAVRAILKEFEITSGISIATQADLPSKSGVGSSSAFCVALINAVARLTGRTISPIQIAKIAIKIERSVLAEAGGWQDAVWSSCGDFNKIHFRQSGDIDVTALDVSQEFLKEFEESLLLVFTGISRQSGQIAKTYEHDKDCDKYHNLKDLAERALLAIHNEDIDEIKRLLDESWQQKRALSSSISSPEIDKLYAIGKEFGAAGKLIGSGGGGYMLFLMERPIKWMFTDILDGKYIYVEPKINFKGAEIIFSNGYKS